METPTFKSLKYSSQKTTACVPTKGAKVRKGLSSLLKEQDSILKQNFIVMNNKQFIAKNGKFDYEGKER